MAFRRRIKERFKEEREYIIELRERKFNVMSCS